MTARGAAAAALVFAAAAATPLAQALPGPGARTVVLLLDVSASMTQTPLPLDARYAHVFNAFLLGLRPGDRAALGVFAGEAEFSPVVADPRELSAVLRRLLQAPERRRGPSAIWDAVDRALPLAGAPGGAIVLFTDGKAAGNMKGLDDVIAHARARGIRVHAVDEGPGTTLLARAVSSLDPARAIERLTGETGGRTLLDRPVDPRQRNPGPLVALIMDGLGH
jgi:hypothetical protein